jgi:hypothetical protein
VSSAEEIRYSAKEIAKQILRLYKQYAIVSHTSRLIGDNGSIELFYWKGSDINSEEVIFETENEMNETMAQKRSMIFELLKSGLLHDENGQMSSYTKNKILEQLGFGIWENGRDLNTLHKNSAIKENNELLHNSQIKSPYEIDDHEIHISEHIAFMLGGEFEKYKNDEMEKLILDHINNHKKMINKSNITSGE